MREIKNKYLIPSVLLLVWMGIFSFANGSCQSFWADELASIGYVRTGISLKEMLDTYLHVDTNLPLYSVILYAVYRMVPYGEQFLLIPSIVFSVIGVMFLAMTGTCLKGERAGFVTLCMGISSGVIIGQGAWEIRCYGLTFLMSTIVLYVYIQKYLKGNRKYIILYGVAITFFFYTHWFACILIGLYGIADVISILRKKISWWHLLCYVPGAMLFLPWFLVSVYEKRAVWEDFWAAPPEWKNMVWTVLFYLDGNRVLWCLCLITGAAILFYAVVKKSSLQSAKKTEIFLASLCVIAIGWVIGIVFLYSCYINPQGSMYVERYFMVVAPHILLVTSLGIDFILDAADRLAAGKSIEKLAIFKNAMVWILRLGILILLLVNFMICYRNQYIIIRKPFQEYREAADYLIEEKGIWNEKSLFMGSNKYCMLDGFIDYYFEKRGYNPPCNIIDSMVNRKQESRFYRNYTEFTEDELLSYDKIYLLTIHMKSASDLDEFLADNYHRVMEQEEKGIEIWERRD